MVNRGAFAHSSNMDDCENDLCESVESSNKKHKNSNLVGNRLMTKNDWLKRLAFACLAFVTLLVHQDEDISTKTTATARRRPPSSRNDQKHQQLASETTNSILSSQQQSLLKQGTSCTNTIMMAGSGCVGFSCVLLSLYTT